ncbi:MAG: ComEC/Rec2 family competence protein, partial [Steroidobacteraceae bacterium]
MWRIAVGALAGTCLALSLPRLPPTVWLWPACALALLLAWRWRAGWVCSLVVGAASCCVALQSALDDRLDPGLENRPLRLRGTVVSVPQGTARALKFRFAPDRHGEAAPLPQLIELTWYDVAVPVAAAARLELEVKLRRPRGFANPGGQDNEARMLRERIGASGYVRRGSAMGA